MGAISKEVEGAATGSKAAPRCSSSLFPSEKPKRRPRASITAKLDELIGGRIKEVAVAVYPDMSVKSAEGCLRHRLEPGKKKKRLSVEQLDAILDELTPHDEAEFMAFFAERRMFQRSERMTTVEWALRELSAVAEKNRARGVADAEERDRLARIEEALRASLEER